MAIREEILGELPPDQSTGMNTSGLTTAEYQDHPRINGGVLLSKVGMIALNQEHEIHTAHGEVPVGLGSTHYKAYFPENRAFDGIGYLFHGLSAFLKTSEPLGKAFARAGMAFVVADQSHLSTSAIEDLTDSVALQVVTAEQVFLDLGKNSEVTQKMPEGRQAINEQRLISGHSYGGLGSTRFAEAYPDETETIALLKAVGVNKSIILQFIKSVVDGTVIGAGKHDLAPYLMGDDIERSWKNVARAAKYFGVGWPLLQDRRPTRAIGEVLSCLAADTRESLVNIGDQNTKRIGVEGGRDPLIRYPFDFKAYVDRYVTFDQYGHMMPQSRPDLVVEAVLGAREDLRYEEQQSVA